VLKNRRSGEEKNIRCVTEKKERVCVRKVEENKKKEEKMGVGERKKRKKAGE
jgi:hypothetical protein